MPEVPVFAFTEILLRAARLTLFCRSTESPYLSTAITGTHVPNMAVSVLLRAQTRSCGKRRWRVIVNATDGQLSWQCRLAGLSYVSGNALSGPMLGLLPERS